MLFLGSLKYPKDTEMNEFLAEHGGSDNAFTGTEHTNFHFSVVAEYLEPALDRFACFFTSPLFNQNAIDREINAVNSGESYPRID